MHFLLKSDFLYFRLTLTSLGPSTVNEISFAVEHFNYLLSKYGNDFLHKFSSSAIDSNIRLCSTQTDQPILLKFTHGNNAKCKQQSGCVTVNIDDVIRCHRFYSHSWQQTSKQPPDQNNSFRTMSRTK